MTEITNEIEVAVNRYVHTHNTDPLSRSVYALAIALANGCVVIAESLIKKRNV